MKIDSFCIKMLLAERGLTIGEFERRNGIAQNTFGKILKRGSCSLVMAGRIAKGLGVPLKEFVVREGN